MPSNPFLGDGGQNLSQLLMALGSGFSMASAANQPWWAGIGPAAGLYGQAQQQAEDRAYRQQQIEQNNQYRQLQEEALRAQIEGKRADQLAAQSYVPSIGMGGQSPVAAGGSVPGMAPPVPKPVMGGGQNYDARVAGFEGGKKNDGMVYNELGSGAFGPYQFMPQTWAAVRAQNPGLNLPEDMTMPGATPEQRRAAHDTAHNAFKAGNASALQSAGLQPTPENLYLAHRFGAGGAIKMLQANPEAMLADVLPVEWQKQNPDMRGQTVGGFQRLATERMGGVGVPYAAYGERTSYPDGKALPPINIGGPPPQMPEAPSAPPSPVVLTGGQPVPMQPAAPQSNLPPPPEPPTLPEPQLTPQELANVRQERAKSGVAAAERLAREYVNARQAPLIERAKMTWQRDMEVYKAKIQDAQWLADYRLKGEQFADKMKLEREQAAQKSANDPVSADGRVQQGPIDAAAAKKRAESEASLDTTVATDLVKGAVDRFIKEDRPKGLAVQEVIPQIHNIRRLVEAGAITGPGTEFRNVLSQVAQTVGFKSPEATITPAYLAGLADQIVANAKALGVNPTNRDNEIIERAKGANPNNSKEAVLALLDLQEQMQRNVHRRYTDEAKRVQNMRGVKSAYGEDYFNLPEPQTYQEWLKANPLPQSATPGGTGGVKRFNPATGRIE